MIALPTLAAALVSALVAFAQDEDVRTAAAAGTLYPADAEVLRERVTAYLNQASPQASSPGLKAVLVPLGLYDQTGPAAGAAVGALRRDAARVVIVTPWHPTFDHLPQDRRAMAGRAAIASKRAYRTPLGDVPLAAEANQLRRTHGVFADVPAAHYWEPGIETVLPFLQCRFGERLRIVPLVVDKQADAGVVAAALAPILQEDDAVLVVTAAPRSGGAGNDRGAALMSALAGSAAEGAWAPAENDLVALSILQRLKQSLTWDATLLGTSTADGGPAALGFAPTSVETAMLQRAAEATWHDPATAAAFKDALQVRRDQGFQGQLLSPPEQELLLNLARNTIAAKLSGDDLPPTPLYSPTLSQKRGCFVTLNKGKALRGCLGIIEPTHPLAAAVQRYALAAAFEDKRFKPVTAEELPELTLEISVLTTPETLVYSDPEDLLAQLEPGRHGVLLQHRDGSRSTYLPQVWSQFPQKAHFLSTLCRKAGMPADAWKDPAAMTVRIYEDFTFAE